MALDIFYSTQYVIYLLGLISLLLIISRFGGQTADFRWLAVYLFISLSADGISMVLFNYKINPNYSSNTFGIISPLIFLFFYSHVIGPKNFSWELLFTIGLIQLIFALCNFFFIQKIEFNSYTSTLNSLVIIILCIYFFFRLLKDLPAIHVLSMPMFWIISAFFFSNAGKLVIYSVRHYLIRYLQDNLIVVWTIHNFLSIIANFIILYGVWLNNRQLRSTFSSQ